VRPNWRRPARHRLEAFDDVPDVGAALADVTRRRAAARAARKPQLPAELAERPPVLGDMDADLFVAGLHGHVQDMLGSRLALVEGVPGAHFRAWVPGAREVAVVLAADAQHASHAPHSPHAPHSWVRPLRSVEAPSGDAGQTGLWEAFVPGVVRGFRYRFRITESDGRIREVRDPAAFREDGEASILWDLDHAWNDHDWRRQRAEPGRPAPDTVLARVADDLTWSSTELIASLSGQVTSAGADHIVLPLEAWRSPGSPFAPSEARGTPQSLMDLVDTLHVMGIGVFVEWSPDVLLVEGFDDAIWSCPAAASLRLSAAAFWVDAYHADGLRLPAGSTNTEWPAGLAARLAAQAAGVVLQTP
jgi:1,4-alpha-glucan branching enzyme